MLKKLVNLTKPKKADIGSTTWVYLTLEKENKKKVIDGLARNLTSTFFPKEKEIFDLLADQYLANFEDTSSFSATNMQVSGLPLGNLSDLGTLKILPFASVVLQAIYQSLGDEDLTMPGVRRKLLERPEITAAIQKKVFQDFPLDPKLAIEFWDKTMDWLIPRYLFTQNEPSGLEEDRSLELKQGVAVGYILDIFPKYAVGFLNSEGGRIFFGIEDKQKLVIGGNLSSQEKDEILKSLQNIRGNIFPTVSPSIFEIHFHPVVDRFENEIANLYVVEIVVAKAVQNFLYKTSSGKRGGVFLRVDGVVKELNDNEIKDEQRRRCIPQE